MLIAIDQLPTWSFDPQLELFEGGLRRLLDHGTYYPNAAFPYAVTLTAPGHAALGTGAPPAKSGIMGNHWYDPTQGRVIGAVDDPDAPTLAMVRDAGPPSAGVSARNLLVEGVADELRRATDGRGRSIAVALKDRAAVLMLGKQPDLAIWYDPNQLAMTTSQAYAETPPAWLTALAEQKLVPRLLDFVWEPLDAEQLQDATGRGDVDWGGGPAFGLGNTFPYRLAETPKPERALAATPVGNTLVLEATRAAIEGEQLGADAIPDLLGIGFSSHDYAGHLWGQESWERLDMLLRIDRELAELFSFLDERVGEGAWVAVLTSDHGATPLPETVGADTNPFSSNTLQHGEVRRVVEEALTQRLGPGPWVSAVVASTVHLETRFDEAAEDERAEALHAAVAALRSVAGIGHVAARSSVAQDCGLELDIEALVCWSFRPDRSGAILFTAAAGHYAADQDQAGTSHGSSADHDRYVPVIVYAPGWPAVRRDEHVSALQVAPTLSRLLGIEPPPAARAPALEP